MREIFFQLAPTETGLKGDQVFVSAVKAVTWRFAGELWQVMSLLLLTVATLPFQAAPIVEIP
jgi:hypothetical protein